MDEVHEILEAHEGAAGSDTAATHAAILGAAAQIISHEPFEALSMRRVASDAGVSLSTVVRHFGTKDALLGALVAMGEDDPARAPRYEITQGSVAEAVRVVVDEYEAEGDTLLNVLGQEHRFPALSRLIDTGRVGHREWIRWAFEPQLRRRRGGRRQLVEDLLVVATDVYTWKLLRRDRALGVDETRHAMTELTRAVIAS
jgi:AcrR family transcriptional regulator